MPETYINHHSNARQVVAARNALMEKGKPKVSMDMALSIANDPSQLEPYGIHLTVDNIRSMAMDADLPGNITQSSINTPAQFLQYWMPGMVEIIQSARKIDDVVGISQGGEWHSETVVVPVLERQGNARVYSDYANTAASDWNVNFNQFEVVRFEEGVKVGPLEAARASEIRVDSAGEKRMASMTALEIERNRVGFFGFNTDAGGSSLGRTYGFLNDPGLPAYISVPDNGTPGETQWAQKDYQQIVDDLKAGFSLLRTQSDEKVDPDTMTITIAVATAVVDQLATVTDFSNSVWDWLAKSYPRARVVSAPELNAANGGENVFYMFAENVPGSGSDSGRTFEQVVPTRFLTLGVEQLTKGFQEAHSNATAGVFCKRPYAVVRYTGV